MSTAKGVDNLYANRRRHLGSEKTEVDPIAGVGYGINIKYKSGIRIDNIGNRIAYLKTFRLLRASTVCSSYGIQAIFERYIPRQRSIGYRLAVQQPLIPGNNIRAERIVLQIYHGHIERIGVDMNLCPFALTSIG